MFVTFVNFISFENFGVIFVNLLVFVMFVLFVFFLFCCLVICFVIFATFICAILFKVSKRVKLLFLFYLGEYSYSFQGSYQLIRLTVTVSLFFWQNAVRGNNSSQEFASIFCNYSYMI